MDDLTEFIQGQFAEFAGHDELEYQTTIWCHIQRQHRRESSEYDRQRYVQRKPGMLEQHRAWRIANPGYGKIRRARKAEHECRQGGCTATRVDDKALCQPHLDKDRERAKAKRQEARAA